MINDLDEGSLLERIFPRLGPANVPVGPGDDAAVIDAPDARTVISIDTLVQDQDFRLEWPSGYRTTGYDVGWKSVAQNLSDINAMGAVPTALVISLTLPGRRRWRGLRIWPTAWPRRSGNLARTGAPSSAAIWAGATRWSSRPPSPAISKAAVRCSAAGRAAGDIVAVAGTLGQAAAGLSLLDSTHFKGEARDGLQALANIQSRPEPPLHAGPAAAKAGATAMMDISDGLLRDAARLARASSVSVDLVGKKLRDLPFHSAAQRRCAKRIRWTGCVVVEKITGSCVPSHAP